MENGKEQLHESFEEIEMINYIDSLEVTEAEPLINYILSFGRIKENINDENLREFKNYINDILDKDGKIKISKDTGIFIAKKPNK